MLFFPSLKGTLERGEGYRSVYIVSLYSAVTAHHPREYDFNRGNFIRGYVYAPCFTGYHKFYSLNSTEPKIVSWDVEGSSQDAPID